MSTTLKFESFAPSNIRERSALSADAPAGAITLQIDSTEGILGGQSIYVGELGREGCEKAVVDTVDSATDLTLVSGLTLPHARFSAVTAVLGDRIRVYRAVNVTDVPPADEAFSVLATRSIDPDQPDTFYTDSAGSAGYWYRYTYFNELTMEETELDEFDPIRGNDFAHYASIEAIRQEAGFENAPNLSDVVVDAQRRAAETEINSALGGSMTVPFKHPVPGIIETITIKLAAGFLTANAYRRNADKEPNVVSARSLIASLQSGESATGLEDGSGDADVSSWPDDSTAVDNGAFTMEQRF